ncbi:hypothetical protein CHUAL_006458 [Chamberlinius hualienensis]
MDQLSRYPPYSKKFHTLESPSKSKQNDRPNSANGHFNPALSLDEAKSAMKNGVVAHNGINGILLRPLDLDDNDNKSNNIQSSSAQQQLPELVNSSVGNDEAVVVTPVLVNGTVVNIPQQLLMSQQSLGALQGVNKLGPGAGSNGNGQPQQHPFPLAVEARNLCKSYGPRNNKINVLKRLNLTVPQGVIYGLLGPSGCGKTTLLKAIVGRLNIKSGFIKVFGHYPGTPESGIPGHRVGYMPQDIALFNEFTIQETLEYFGRIYKMNRTTIQRRMFFLLEFLHLPKANRFVKNLSGGQKRRVSFAVALLKEPPLLILDEPTVGVDPLLRQSIWNHLVTIAKDGKTTIIITTHYIEEARQAHVVGLMRNGRLLAEDSPERMLIEHSLPNLEEVFLKLCMQTRGGAEEGALDQIGESAEEVPQITADGKVENGELSGIRTSASNGNIYPFNSSMEVLVNDDKPPRRRWCNLTWKISLNKVWALVIKNMLKLWRNLGYLGFQFLLPSIQIILFCLAIGRDPMGLPMAVVNLEGVDNNSLNFGQLFLEFVDKDVISQVTYYDHTVALEAVRVGDVWGVLEIPRNFSQDLLTRVYQGPAATDDVINGSILRIFLDSTNQQIAYAIKEKILSAFQDFSIAQMNSTGSNPKLGQIPIQFEDPIYGTRDPNFTEFMAPGIILSVSYFMAVGLTALTFVLERKEGLLDRTWVAGVNVLELMIGHFFTQFFVMVVQIALSLLFMIVAFQVPCQGPPIWVILLTLAQGMCGMAYGLLISSFCDEENSAIMFALGSFYPSLLLSGIIWPIESMPSYLRYISYVVPQTYATEALRALLSRGWDITYMVVWRGFVSTIGWFFVFFILSAVIFRLRR